MMAPVPPNNRAFCEIGPNLLDLLVEDGKGGGHRVAVDGQGNSVVGSGHWQLAVLIDGHFRQQSYAATTRDMKERDRGRGARCKMSFKPNPWALAPKCMLGSNKLPPLPTRLVDLKNGKENFDWTETCARELIIKHISAPPSRLSSP